MRSPWLIFIYLCFPILAFAQSGNITGVVTNAESKKPVARATVFLSNSSVGAASQENGAYGLTNIRPGEYTLIARSLGFQTFEKKILIGNEPIKLDIALIAKPLMLREVVISSAADWKKNYEWFRRDFIGVDNNAKFCDVINPHILDLLYNQTKQTLSAKGEEFLVVENRALGYRIKFLVDSFSSDRINGIISYGGQRLFEELPGSESQKQKWHEKREEAYYGSSMHFYRTLLQNRLDLEGFAVYKFSRYLNSERPKEEILRQKLKQFQLMQRRDSFMYYRNLELMPKYSSENILKPPLLQYEIFTRLEQPGLYVLHFNKFLYVVFTKKHEQVPDSRDFYRPLDAAFSDYEASILTLEGEFPVFDNNGTVVRNNALYEGTWATKRLSDTLPVDYVPDVK